MKAVTLFDQEATATDRRCGRREAIAAALASLSWMSADGSEYWL